MEEGEDQSLNGGDGAYQMQCTSVSRLCRMWEEVGGSDQVAKRREGVGLIPTTTPAGCWYQTSLSRWVLKTTLNTRCTHVAESCAPP